MSNNTPESKLVKRLRTILSFVLAIIISSVSIACCFSASFFKQSDIEKYFISFEYTQGVKENLYTYVSDYYQKSGFDTDKLDEYISYEAVSEAVKNYAGYYISHRVGFEEDAYINSIDKIIESIRADISEQIKLSNQNNDAKMLESVTANINEYFKDEISLNGIEKLDSMLNIGLPAFYIIIGIGLFLFVFVALILYFLGEKRYRSLRALTISFLTAGIFDVCLAVMVFVISRVKKFDVYPIYLYDEFMKYVNTCIGTVAAAGFICIIIAFAFASVTWIKKVKGSK